jgi:hypothetical protein
VAKNAPKLIAMFIGHPAPAGAPVLDAYLHYLFVATRSTDTIAHGAQELGTEREGM